MRIPDLYNEEDLSKLLQMQQEHEWDLETAINWSIGIDGKMPFLTFDEDDLLFPNLTNEERLAVSQYLGIVFNTIASEIEVALKRWVDHYWENFLARYPVSPEFRELGEQFFKDEQKHALAFQRFNHLFACHVNVSDEELKMIIPKFASTWFEDILMSDHLWDCFAVWWGVAAVEEDSIILFKHLQKQRSDVDPLFFELHLRHFQEESRHASFAFLMLQLLRERTKGTVKGFLHRKLDVMFTDAFRATWFIGQAFKLKNLKKLKERDPFFVHLLTALPKIKDLSFFETLHRIFKTTPYFATVFNTKDFKQYQKVVKEFEAWSFPLPDLELKNIKAWERHEEL